jgi:hypothetical protein
MMRFASFLALRAVAIAFFLLTAAYGIVSYSPFAFDMFIRPQLLPWVNDFVAWHHLWYLGAYAASVASLWHDLDWRRSRAGADRAAHRLAIGYAAIFGAVALKLAAAPHLPTLWNDSRSLVTGLAAFVPLLWLAAIDHLAALHAWNPADDGPRGGRVHRLLVTCASTAAGLWAVHLAHAVVRQADGRDRIAAWILTGGWTFALTTTAFGIAFTFLALIDGCAALGSRPRRCAHLLTVAAIAAGLCELFRRLVLPAISLDAMASLAVGPIAGIALALTWSGIAVRRPRADERGLATPLELLFAPAWSTRWTAVALAALPIVALSTIARVERLDWDFVLQRLVVIAEWVVAFGLMLRLTAAVRDRAWSIRAVAVAPIAAMLVFAGLPRAAATQAAWSGDQALQPTLVFQRHAAAEPSFALLAKALVRWPGFDAGYHRHLQVDAAAAGSIQIPEVDFAPAVGGLTGPSTTRRPDIYLFVVDSLRRDYLSPYNAAVSFTPNIDRFAGDAFVFRNAFTRHGGTALAIPSIWTGSPVVRKILGPGFERMNTMQKLLDAEGYRIAINDYTVAGRLNPSVRPTVIDPGVPSPETDLCSNLTGLQHHLAQPETGAHPLFAFFAPMNVHLINTRHEGQAATSDGDYPGFYGPYASRLKRIDGCFGDFVAYLKREGHYDDSIIIVTSDHGDSLGEEGLWGHAFWLFPEDIRIPLILKVPAALQPELTTDLSRIAFSTDIAPTLYTLLQHDVRDPGPIFGAPLLVARGRELQARRRESYLVTSSYAPTYALLRRNGRSLYVSDLFERKEFAFDLSREPIGTQVLVDNAVRRVNQRLIRDRVTELSAFFRKTTPGAGSQTLTQR